MIQAFHSGYMPSPSDPPPCDPVPPGNPGVSQRVLCDRFPGAVQQGESRVLLCPHRREIPCSVGRQAASVNLPPPLAHKRLPAPVSWLGLTPRALRTSARSVRLG